MAYTKTTWVNRLGTNLNKFTKSSETSTTVILQNTPDAITQAGTEFSATRMNNIETGIDDVHNNTMTFAGLKTFSERLSTGVNRFTGYPIGSITTTTSYIPLYEYSGQGKTISGNFNFTRGASSSEIVSSLFINAKLDATGGKIAYSLNWSHGYIPSGFSASLVRITWETYDYIALKIVVSTNNNYNGTDANTFSGLCTIGTQSFSVQTTVTEHATQPTRESIGLFSYDGNIDVSGTGLFSGQLTCGSFSASGVITLEALGAPYVTIKENTASMAAVYFYDTAVKLERKDAAYFAGGTSLHITATGGIYARNNLNITTMNNANTAFVTKTTSTITSTATPLVGTVVYLYLSTLTGTAVYVEFETSSGVWEIWATMTLTSNRNISISLPLRCRIRTSGSDTASVIRYSY